MSCDADAGSFQQEKDEQIIRQASLETWSPEVTLRHLVKRGKSTVFKPDDGRRVFIHRASLDRLLLDGLDRSGVGSGR